MRRFPALCLLGMTLLLPVAANAQSRTPAPITAGVTSGDLAATVDRLRSANAEMQAQASELEAQNAQLTGRVETLEFLLSQTNDELNRLQVDNTEIGKRLKDYEARFARLEKRLAAAEAAMSAGASAGAAGTTNLDTASPDVGEAANAGAAGAVATSPAQPAPGETIITGADGSTRVVRRTVTSGETSSPVSAAKPPEGTLGTLPASQLPGEAGPLFAEAKSRLLRFDYAGAEQAFRAFLDVFGEDPQAGEAKFWLGEVLYQQGQYAASGTAFTEMLRDNPNDERAPDALVKLARSLRLVGDTKKACLALDTLPKRYPKVSSVTQNLANVERVRSACDG